MHLILKSDYFFKCFMVRSTEINLVIDGDAFFHKIFHDSCKGGDYLFKVLTVNILISKIKQYLYFFNENNFRIKAIFYDALFDQDKIRTTVSRKNEKRKDVRKSWKQNFVKGKSKITCFL